MTVVRPITDPLRAALVVVFVATLLLATWPPRQTAAAPALVNSATNFSPNVSSMTATLSPAATAGDLLVVVCASAAGAGALLSGPTGFAAVINESTNVSQGIFYTIAAGGENSFTCTASLSVTLATQVFEYSGMHNYQLLEASSSSTAASGTAIATGSLNTLHANDLLIASATNTNGSAISGWGSSFAGLTAFGQTNGSAAKKGYFSTASRTVTSAGTYSSTASMGTSGAWRGQIVAFRTLASPQSLGADIVNASGVTIASPAVAMSALTTGFGCQNSSGTLGISTQKVRVTNNTDNPSWVLALAATGGAGAAWTAGPLSYAYNNPAGSGCSNGQLSVDPSSSTIAPQTNCSQTDLTKGAAAAFSAGATDAVTVASSANGALTDCYWDITGVPLTQRIPAAIPSGAYSLNLTLTITAN